MRPLTNKQAEFVSQYLLDLNSTQAAIRAGYSKKTAGWIGPQLLAKTHIQALLSLRISERAERTQVTADYVLTTIRNTVERCAKAEPVIGKDGQPTGEYRFDATAVLKGCELLGKHLKMFVDRVEVSGEIDIAARILEARRRVGIEVQDKSCGRLQIPQVST
jgi:phage terminase small subunit